MSDDRRKIELDLRRRFGIDENDDLLVVKVSCDLTTDCVELRGNTLEIDWSREIFVCANCGETGSLSSLNSYKTERSPRRAVVPHTASLSNETAPESYNDGFQPVQPGATQKEPNVHTLKNRLPTAAEREAQEESKRDERRRSFSEKLIVATLALIFLGAGLASAALSGYANFHAFSASVSDPLQSRIWGWTGVIAAVISFGGFTLFYWHRANHRRWEGLRALIFALVGAGTSILGTQMYIAANGQSADAEAAAAQSNRAVIEAQIADWRVQLNGIPPGTRTVEGLEAYIAEVERVGKTEQKPYRDAKNELGLAKRRDELQARIDAANATLLGKGSSDILITAQTRTRVPDWIFAVILEIFSSQGTSIGLVALLLLFGGRRPASSS